MTPIRERAKRLLDTIPIGQIKSNDVSGNYQKYTGGLKHETMEANWRAGGIMTGCNAFVGWYATQLGSTNYLGRFDLVTFLPSIGKGHAWVKSASGRRPQYGDILLHTSLHVDVALDFDGDILNRIAAGQGGPGVKCDILCRVRGKSFFNFANLQGWVDIDLYFGATPTLALVPSWLIGWWNVWDGNQYYYFFDPQGFVQYTKTKPVNNNAPPKIPLNQGTYSITSTGLVIDWNPADGGATKETFTRQGWTSESEMNGVSNRYAPLFARKM